ncbi:MAG: hypothetical protein R3Y44_02040 [Rikenellaceae bacterium]
MEKKITVIGVISDAVGIGIKNVVPLILTYLLWFVSLIVPYINVGTTIAVATIPLELSKGNIINPLFIFDPKFRRFMGEYLILVGLIGMGMAASVFFFFIPMIVIAVAWSLAILIFLDKRISPLDAIMQSNEATYGYKWTIFGIRFVLGIIGAIFMRICLELDTFGIILLIAGAICLSAIGAACDAVIYRNLVVGTSTPEPEPEPASEE